MTSQRTRDRMLSRLREQGIKDEVTLSAMGEIPRHIFVDEALATRAYEDVSLPIGFGQTISQPYTVAKMTETLRAGRPLGKVLEIGTGAGYLTALMGLQAKHVDSLELNSKLSAAAAKRIAAHKIKNVSLKVADGLAANEGSYDVIVLTGSLPVYPVEVERQLAVGGRMFVVVGDAPAMEATLITRISSDNFKTDVLFETCLPAIVNAPQAEKFEF